MVKNKEVMKGYQLQRYEIPNVFLSYGKLQFHAYPRNSFLFVFATTSKGVTYPVVDYFSKKNSFIRFSTKQTLYKGGFGKVCTLGYVHQSKLLLEGTLPVGKSSESAQNLLMYDISKQ